GVGSTPDYPGRLGFCDAAAARKKVPADAPQRARILRTIAEHDLSAERVVPESYGSGIVIDRSGLVLTCAHVVKNATKLYVRLPSRQPAQHGSWADIPRADPRSDLGVLRLPDPPADLKALDLGKQDDIRTGQYVVCLSNAFAPGFRPASSVSIGDGRISSLR